MALTDDLIAWWDMDAVAGARNDSHGILALSDPTSVGSDAAGINGRAASFVAASVNRLSLPAACLPGGITSFTAASWVKLATKAASRAVISRDSEAREWIVWCRPDTDRFAFTVFNPTGTFLGTFDATDAGSPAVGVWHCVIAWHDAVNQQLGIEVNGVANVYAHAAGVANGASSLLIGQHSGDFWDGLIDTTAFWSRALTAGERSDFRNGGAGVTYSDIAASGGIGWPLLRRIAALGNVNLVRA